MKKFLTMLLAVMMIFTLAACSGNGNSDEGSAEPEEEKMVVGLSVVDMKNQFWVDWSDAMQAEADEQGLRAS